MQNLKIFFWSLIAEQVINLAESLYRLQKLASKTTCTGSVMFCKDFSSSSIHGQSVPLLLFLIIVMSLITLCGWWGWRMRKIWPIVIVIVIETLLLIGTLPRLTSANLATIINLALEAIVIFFATKSVYYLKENTTK